MITLEFDYVKYCNEIFRIIKGEKISIVGNKRLIAKIQATSEFYAVPESDIEGLLIPNRWLLGLNPIKTAVIAASTLDYERFLDKFIVSKSDLQNYRCVLHIGDTRGHRFDGVINLTTDRTDLLHVCLCCLSE
jgi:hypothetical protein